MRPTRTGRPSASALSVTVGAPGSVVAGQPLEVVVRCRAEEPVEIVDGQVELVRTSAVTHVRHQPMGAVGTVSNRNAAVTVRADVDMAGPLDAGQELERRMTLVVPPDEATISGYLVQQEYAVRVRLRAAEGRPAENAIAVRVGHPGTGRNGGIEGGDDSAVAALTIADLPSLQLSSGRPLTGTVTVTTCRTAGARGARIELVLDEHVPGRAEEQVEADSDARTVVLSVPLAGRLQLEPGQPVRMPFMLEPPCPLPAPSISTPAFTVRWLLRAVLDRALRPDPEVTVELAGTTAG